MKIEGVDYFVHLIKMFSSVNACTTVNADGTYTIMIDRNLAKEKQKELLAHELFHVESGHLLFRDSNADVLEYAAHKEQSAN